MLSLAKAEEVRREVALHAGRILALQDGEGMIPSHVEWIGKKEAQRTRDIPRQAMSTMALAFAERLAHLNNAQHIERSRRFIETHVGAEPPINQFYAWLYLALARAYAAEDASRESERIAALMSPEMFDHPIAINLYIRLSALLPEPLPHVAYFVETQRFALSRVPRRNRFFDHADVLVWGKQSERALAEREYAFLRSCKTTDGWYAAPHTHEPVLASVAAKLFEAFSYFDPGQPALELYRALCERVATTGYERSTMEALKNHILSQQGALVIDDAHTHILVGLCYRLQTLV
jgi:hypothetical protein